MSAPEYHRLGGERLRGDRKRLGDLEQLLLEKFSRWETLEELRARSAVSPSSRGQLRRGARPFDAIELSAGA